MRVQLGVSTYVQLVFAASQGPMLMSICMHMYMELYTYTHAQLNHDLYTNIYTVHTYIHIYIHIHTYKYIKLCRVLGRCHVGAKT